MTFQEKSLRLISLLDEAETLASELGIVDKDRFDALRYWATLAAEINEDHNRSQ